MAPTKLTPALLEIVEEAVGLGLSTEEVALAVGVSASAFYEWKAKGERCRDYFTRHKGRHRREDLERLARALEVKASPRGKRETLANLGARLQEVGAKYVEFVERLRTAAPKAESSLLLQLERAAKGGKVVIETDPETGEILRRCLRRRKRVVERALVQATDPDTGEPVDAWQPTKTIETEEEIELPPNPKAILRLLAIRWPEKYGKQKASSIDAEGLARRIGEASEAMYRSVPGPTDTAVGLAVEDVDAITDEEVEVHLTRLSAGPQ